MDTTRTRWLEVPGTPPIPGLRFRRYEGEDDIPALVDVANRFYAATGETSTPPTANATIAASATSTPSGSVADWVAR